MGMGKGYIFIMHLSVPDKRRRGTCTFLRNTYCARLEESTCPLSAPRTGLPLLRACISTLNLQHVGDEMCSMQYNAKVCMDDVFETACHSISNVSLEILDAVIHSTLTMFDISEMVCSIICSSYGGGDV